jgi:Holliday junction resolvasome RuvABC endonuclease subunit
VAINEIVGIDPGVSDCGVFCLSPDGNMTRFAQVKSPPPKGKLVIFEVRAFMVAKKVFEWIHEIPGEKVVAVEGPSFGSGYRNKKGTWMPSPQMEQLAYCRQSLYCMAAFFLPDFLYYSVAPKSAKKVVCSGQASKEAVAKGVAEKFDIDIKTFAISDAASVALYAWERWREAREFSSEGPKVVPAVRGQGDAPG